MEFRDRLKDEAERLGKALAAVLHDFLRLRSNGKLTEGMTLLENELQSQANLDLKDLQSIPEKDDLLAYLETRTALRPAQYDSLAGLITHYSENPYLTNTQCINLRKSALILTDLGAEGSDTWSVEASERRKKLQRMLSDHHHDADDH